MLWLRGFMMSCAMLLASCGEQLDLLDAAAIYEENPEVFHSIEEYFSSGQTEIRRIPPFPPAEARPEDVTFLEQLREHFPVHSIDVVPDEIGGASGIRVVVGAYGISPSGSLVALEYEADPDFDERRAKGVNVFDSCDQRALDWLYGDHDVGFADVYCRLTDNWYAYHTIT